MKRLCLLLLNMLLTFIAVAQQTSLIGVVSIQNSEYNTGTREYVFGASVSARFALDQLTDSEGNFELQFVGEKTGSSINLMVYKAGLETVNSKALEDVVIGRNSPLNIYMCKEGELARNQIKYHEISLKNLYKQKDSIILQLEKGGAVMISEINRLETEFSIEIHGKSDALQQLDKQIESLKNKLPEFAKKMALVNLDDASALYKMAYQFYIQGKPKQAVAILDLTRLLEVGFEATTNIQDLRKQKQTIDETIILLETQITQTVKSLEFASELLKQQFKYQKACSYYKAIVAILESDPIGREKDLSYSNAQIGRLLGYSGNYSEALIYLRKALAINQRIYPEIHPIVAETYNNLALIYKEQWNLEKALITQKKALTINKQLHPEHYPTNAIAYSNLAQIYQAQGKLEEALVTQERVLFINQQLYPEIHPAFGIAYNNLAQIYQAQGKLERALVAQEKALIIDKQIYAEIHPIIAIRYNNLAQIYQAQGKLAKALVTQEKAFAIDKQIYQEIHPKIAQEYNNLAQIYKAQGKLEKALITQKKALTIDEQIHLEAHPSIGTDYNNLALIYKAQGKLKEALIARKKALIVDEQLYPEVHPTMARNYNNLARIYESLGNLEKALASQLKALAINRQLNPRAYYKIARDYNNLANIYIAQERMDEALIAQKESLNIFKTLLPKEHPKIIILMKKLSAIYYNIGIDNFSQKKYNHALIAFNQALFNHWSPATIYNYIGLCHYHLEEYAQATKAYREAIQLCPDLKDRSYFNNIGKAYLKNKQFPLALEAFQSYEKLDTTNEKVYRNYLMYYALTNQKDQALTMLEQAVKLGFNDIEWLKTDDSIDCLRASPKFQNILKKIE